MDATVRFFFRTSLRSLTFNAEASYRGQHPTTNTKSIGETFSRSGPAPVGFFEKTGVLFSNSFNLVFNR